MENPAVQTVGSASQEPPKRKFYIERSLGDMSFPSNDRLEKLDNAQKVQHVERTMAVLMEWPNWDIWPFKVAAPTVALAASIPGFVLNSAFRNALLLGHYARASSYLATMGVPAAAAGLVHSLGITSDILEQKTKCPVCLQVRSASFQLAVAFIYPALFVPIANFPIASAMKTSYFPKFHKQPREVLSFALDVMRSVRERYLAVGALQVVVAMGATYFEQQCYMDTLLPILTGEKVFCKETQKIKRIDED